MTMANMTFIDAFVSTATAEGDRITLRARDGRTWTWADYLADARHAAGALRAFGVGRGDTVALLAPNCPEHAIADAGAMLLGVVTSSLYLNNALATSAYVVGDLGAKVLVAGDAQLEAARLIAARAGCVERVLTLDQVLAGTDEIEPQLVDAGDELVVLYTSGTTGPPKGVVHTHATMRAAVAAWDATEPLEGPSVCVSYIPFAHASDRCFHYRAMLHATDTLYCSDPASDLAPALAAARPQLLVAPPRIWSMLLAAGLPGLDRLQSATIAAAPPPRALLDALVDAGVPLRELFAMTEIGPVLMAAPGREELGTVGRPIPGCEVRLGDQDEILVRTPAVTPGYRNRPEATAELIDADGWVHTGDIGTVDERGCFRIVDRLKELIVSTSGHNMSPVNIEQALLSAGGPIAQAVCIGDGRPYNVALIVLDVPRAQAVARDPSLGVAELATDPAVIAAVHAAVASANERLSDPEAIRAHRILPVVWAPGGEELTPTTKLRREPIASRYAQEIADLYAGAIEPVTAGRSAS
jgi:long-subunit acyl-CoA synthetase (AMP-forming)